MEKKQSKFSQRIGKFFAKLRRNFKAFFSKDYMTYSFIKYRAFTGLQYKEVFSREKAATKTSDKIIRIVSPIIRFVIVFALTFVLFVLNTVFNIVQINSIYFFLVFFTTVMFILQLISSTVSCTKSYYIAEDNKVLITFPSSGASLFLSKLTIEFFKELKNTVGLYFPVVLATVMFAATSNPQCPFQIGSVFWLIFPMILYVAIIVLLASLLSVLYLQYLRLVKVVPVIRIIVLAALFTGVIYLAVLVINKIPENIELRTMWNDIRFGIDDFLIRFNQIAVPASFFMSVICGFTGAYKGYRLKGLSFGRFGLLLAISIVLFALVFIIIKRLFLHMMTKSVDYEKVNEKANHPNHMHHKHTTFAFKELKISFRTLEISGAYVVTYVLIPVLILLLCKVFDAINTNMKGDMLTIMFNVLLITLPLLASNAPISSAYSREGHAGYMKKTKPIAPYTPMISKLLFNLVLSVPSIAASVYIVGRFAKIDAGSVVILGICILLLQYAHIFYSSTLDFTNPRNENYQTEGQGAKNPNENVSTVVAFVMSAVFAFVVFFLFKEQVVKEADTFMAAAVRVLFVSIVIFSSCLLLYFLKLKAFFMER